MGTTRLRQPAQQVAFAADGKTPIATGADHQVTTWDVATGRYLRGQRLEGTQGLDLSATTLAPDVKPSSFGDGAVRPCSSVT
jgi:hypothetical protein